MMESILQILLLVAVIPPNYLHSRSPILNFMTVPSTFTVR